MPGSTRRTRLLAAFVLPFVLHTVILLASQGIQGTWARWLLSGVVPVVIGFVYLEQELKLHAAWLALVYVPVMMGLLLALNLVIGGLIFGASI